MSKIFSINFFPKDWLTATSELTLEERGVYIQLIMTMYAREHHEVEYEERWLASICNCSTRKLRPVIKSLIEKSFISLADNNKISQKVVKRELEKTRYRLEICAKGGHSKNNSSSIEPPFEAEPRPNRARTDAQKEPEPNEIKDLTSSNTNTNTNTNSNIVSRAFKKPTIEEISNYCLERNNQVDCNRFYDFYVSKDWMIGKNKMKDWKAAIRNWERMERGKPTTIRETLNKWKDAP